jgi:hypothetical protein
MTYAMRYLAGAYRAAGGNESRAIALYQHGYYYQAKAQGFSPYTASAPSSAGWGYGGVTPAFQTSFQTSAYGGEQYRSSHRRHYRT